MSVEFKRTIPGVFVAECPSPRTGKFNCLVVMQSMQRWSAFIDGDAVGSGFPSAAEAQAFAINTLTTRQNEARRLKHTVMAFAALATGAVIYWAAASGHIGAVSKALAGAVLTEPVSAAQDARPSGDTQLVALSPAAKQGPKKQVAAIRLAKLEIAPPKPQSAPVAAAPLVDAPLIHPPRDNIALPPLPAANVAPQPPRFARLRPAGQASQAGRKLPEPSQHSKRRRQPASRKPRGSLNRIVRKKRRAAVSKRRAVPPKKKVRRTKKRAPALRRLARQNAAKRLAKIKDARKAKAIRNKQASRKLIAKRRRLAERKRLAGRKSARIRKRRVRGYRLQRSQSAIRGRAPRARRGAKSRRQLTYRQFQMLRNRVIAKRIRQRRRYAR